MTLLNIFMPVIWAVVAAAIGMSLYKTSDALVEETSRQQIRGRRIRLTGSAAIAALAYASMWYATVHDKNIGLRENISQGYRTSVAVDRLTLEALAAVTNGDADSCKKALILLRQENQRSLNRFATELSPNPNRPW